MTQYTVGEAHADAMQQAIAVIRLDHAPSARLAFTLLIKKHGRHEASRIWVQATDQVEARADYLDTPTRVAPDCEMGCAESYVNDGCDTCSLFEQIRRPHEASSLFTCACGFQQQPTHTLADVFDHIDTCRVAGTSEADHCRHQDHR